MGSRIRRASLGVAAAVVLFTLSACAPAFDPNDASIARPRQVALASAHHMVGVSLPAGVTRVGSIIHDVCLTNAPTTLFGPVGETDCTVIAELYLGVDGAQSQAEANAALAGLGRIDDKPIAFGEVPVSLDVPGGRVQSYAFDLTRYGSADLNIDFGWGVTISCDATGTRTSMTADAVAGGYRYIGVLSFRGDYARSDRHQKEVGTTVLGQDPCPGY
jgi:hypothetical protein